jgi:uridine kinase
VGEGWLVAIDGAREAGKSTMAKDLARDLPARLISVDDYVQKGEPLGTPYPDLVRVAELRAEVQQSRDQGKIVLLEGICLRSVLARLEMEATLHVYVMRVSAPGEPCEIDLFDDQISEEVLLDQIGIPTSTGASLDRDLAQYHKKNHPHQCADLIYEREES